MSAVAEKEKLIEKLEEEAAQAATAEAEGDGGAKDKK